jgi:phage N-6-adenine-methyltransferase
VSVVGYRARNHPQQVDVRGARSDVDDRATAPEVFGPLNERFGFTIDAAASPANAKCGRFYTEADDGLAQPWANERVWCNPPYSYPNLPAWVAKAWQEWMNAERPYLIVMLLPANRTEQGFWQEHVEPYRDLPGSDLHVEFLPGRMRFLTPGQSEVGPDERPPFGCCLLIWEEREASSSLRLVPDAVAQVRVPRPAGQDALFDLLEDAPADAEAS